MTQEEIDILFRAIAHRRSMGLARLSEDPVDRTLIERALEAANWAPSHGDTEPWDFVVYTGDARFALGDAFAEAYRQSTPDFKQETFESQKQRALWAPVWISLGVRPAVRPDGSLKMEAEEEVMAATCAFQNLHLMMSAQGLAGMWHSKGVSIHPHTAKFVGLEPPARLLGFFFCGWPKIEWPEGERRPWQEKVRWEE